MTYPNPLPTAIIEEGQPGQTTGGLVHHDRAWNGFNTGWLNVRDSDFGAVGNGTADDTAAIQAAIDRATAANGPGSTLGGVVYLPKGLYKVSSAILVKNRVRLIGASRDGSRITAAAGFLSNVNVTESNTTLSAGITTTGQTSISVASANDFPRHGTFKVRIDTEILYITAGGGTGTWTVTRGQDGTTAATHSSGAAVTEVISRVVELGNGDANAFNFAFASTIENLSVYGNGQAMTTCVLTQQANELCEVKDCLVSGHTQYGIYYAPGASGARIDGAEVYAHSSGATYGVYSRAWLSNKFRHITSNGDATNTYAASFALYDTITSLDACHAEKATEGIFAYNADGVIDTFQAHSTVTTAVHLSSNTGTVQLFQVYANGATNTLVDDFHGYTISGSSIRSYNQQEYRIGKSLLRTGTGSPEGAITAPKGSFYLRTDGTGRPSIYAKESGTGTTGWAPYGVSESEILSGLKSQAYDLNAGPRNAAALQGSGRILVVKVPLFGPTTVTNILVDVVTVGATLTAGQNLACLYDSTGAKIANTTTADQSTAWTTTTGKTMAVTGGPTTVDPGAAGWVWVALLTVGTTVPAFRRSNNDPGVANLGTTTTTRRFALDASTGNTALPANLTPSTMTTYEAVWAGLS